MADPIEVFPSQKGKPLLSCAGYLYKQHRENTVTGGSTWRCIDLNCKVKGDLSAGGEFKVKGLGGGPVAHSHEPDPAKIEAKKVSHISDVTSLLNFEGIKVYFLYS